MIRAGVDLGGTKIQTVIVADDHEVLGEDRRPTPQTGGPTDVAAAIVASITTATAAAGISKDLIVMIGVGSPGQIDRVAGTVSNAGNLPDWSGTFALGPELTKHLQRPVRLGNDVQVAVQAEASLGAGRDWDSFLGVFVGTGIGGGVVQQGRLWRGHGSAGEIGHMVVVIGGRICPCGRHGCVEAYAGRAAMESAAKDLQQAGRPTALFDLMEARGRTRVTSGVWHRALQQGDAVATELIDQAQQALGAGIGSAMNLLDVEGVVIGGGLGNRLGAPFVASIREHALTHMVSTARSPQFRLAALGDYGGAIGAAMLGSAG